MNKTPKIVETILPAIPKLEAIKIKDAASMEKATEYMSKANKFLDALKKDREAITKPINDSLKAIRAKYKPTEDKLTAIVANIRTQMTVYQTEQLRLQAEEERKITDMIEKGTLTMETAIKKIENIETPANKTTTDLGSVSFRATPRLKIIDEKLIPREYLIINEDAIMGALKANITVPGAEIEIIQVPVNRRN